MLNDLLAIERGLTARGIDFVGRHPDVKDVAKGSALRVRLAEGGRVSSVEVIPEAGNGAVWTLRDGQHNGLPGLKTGLPVKRPNSKTELHGLLLLDDDARRAHEKEWKAAKDSRAQQQELLRLLDLYPFDRKSADDWPSSGHRIRIRERMEALASLADNPLTAAVPAAFERFLAALSASPSLLEQLASALAERIRNSGDVWLDPVRAALVGPVTLAIDVKDMEFDRDAGDVGQIDAVSRALSAPAGIRQRVWIKKDGEPRLTLSRAFRAAPLSLIATSRLQFVGDGSRKLSVRGVTFSEAFSLFLREGSTTDRANRILAVILRRQTRFISTLTHVDRRGRDEQGKACLESFDPKNELRRDMLRTTGWIGVLLHTVGRAREVYMKDVGFRLGQLLAAADVVHVGYCTDLRGGDIPMTLIGNSVFSIAGTDPKRALSILQRRWRPYETWAKPRPRLTEKIDKIFADAAPLRQQVEAMKDSKALGVKEQRAKLERLEAPGWQCVTHWRRRAVFGRFQ